MEIEANVNYKGLKKVIEAIAKEYTVKVGLLANQGGSDEVSKDLDMAGLGAVHEFGCTINVTDKMRAFFRYKFGVNLKKTTTQITIPARSSLQMPIQDKGLLKKIKQQLDPELAMELITEYGDAEYIAKIIGASAVEQVHEAFDTGGFGEWAENSPITIAEKGSSKQLVDTGSLRQHITFEVEKNG